MISLRPLWYQMGYLGYTKKSLAKKTGVSYPTIQKMYREGSFVMKNIDKICNALALPIEEVLEYKED